MIILRLFLEFARVGFFAIGGGLATLPFLYDLSSKTNWFTHAQLTDMVAVSESTPGPIGVNTATYVGFTTAGIPGALAATFGLILPSVIIILFIARILDKFKENKTLKSLFYGLRPASTALIAAAGISVAKLTLFNSNILNIIVAFLFFIAMKKFPKHPAFYIALAALIGILFKL